MFVHTPHTTYRISNKIYHIIHHRSCIKTHITNIKNIKGKITQIDNINKLICDKLLNKILNYQTINFLEMRDNLYEIFIFNLDIHSCLYYIINNLVEKKYIKDEHTEDIFIELYKFLRLYNNNYRPIYHLESFIFYLCIKIHEL